MKFKRLGYALFLTVIAACALMITACGKSEHTHSYTSSVVNPTCTEKGYTKHTCACGHSYTDAYVDAIGHSIVRVPAKPANCKEAGYTAHEKCENCSYVAGKQSIPSKGEHAYTEVEILVYPTVDTAGKRTIACAGCGDKIEETIDPYILSLPDITEALNALLAGKKYTLDATDSELVLITKKNGTEIESSSIVVKLAEIVLDGSGSFPVGHIKLEIESATMENGVPTDEEELGCYIYINGGTVSVEMVPAEGPKTEFNINEKFYEILEMNGLSLDSLAIGSFVSDVLGNYIPVLAGWFEKAPDVSDGFITRFEQIAALVNEGLITVTQDGDNTVCSVDLSALKEYLTLFEGKTVSEILDDVYGEGSGEAVLSFFSGLTDKKIGNIVNAAIIFAEDYGVPVQDTYYFVNLLVYLATGNEGFDIEAEINENYNKTIADLLVSGASEQETAQAKKELKENITSAVTEILGSTVDGLLGTCFGEGASIEAIKAFFDAMGEAVEIVFVLDENGALVSVDFAYELGGTTVCFSASESDGVVTVEADVVSETEDSLDLYFTVDTNGGVIGMELVVRDDRYIEEEIYDEYWDEYYTESVWLDFGTVLEFRFEADTVGDILNGSCVLSKYDSYTGELVDVLDGAYAYVATEEYTALEAMINGVGVWAYSEATEAGITEFGFGVLDGEDEMISIEAIIEETLDGQKITFAIINGDGETAAEGTLDLEYQMTETEKILIVSYDITKLILGEYLDEALDAYVDVLEGTGELTLTVEG